jgi:hypothetical protein
MNGQALRIFAKTPRPRSLVRPGRPPLVVVVATKHEEAVAPAIAEPTPVEPVAIDPPLRETIEMIAFAIEQTIVDILASAPQYGETIDAAYRRKECALAEVFGSLTRKEAATLHRRLSEPRADDTLAQRFTRLVVDRRTRLLAVLADIPRREARGR